MNIKKQLAYSAGSAILATSIIGFSALFKIQYIIGSKLAFFSGINILGPLSGTLGVFGSLALFVTYCLRSVLIHGLNFNLAHLITAYHIPTILASAYWSSAHALIRFFTPLLCILLFIVHPIGAQAWYYSLYWLMPMALYVFPQRTIFAQALGSTFIAHATGSIIYLYTMPIAAQTWIALIPIVLIERLLFASGMTLVYYLAQICLTLSKNKTMMGHKKSISIPEAGISA